MRKILSFVTIFFIVFFSPQRLSKTIAQVMVSKAIIYADPELTAPLGHVPSGKLIPVGNPSQNLPEIYPVMVQGRIGYIHEQDIRIVTNSQNENGVLSNHSQREHNFDLLFQESLEDDFKKNNFMIVSYGQFSGGSEVQNFFLTVDGEDQSALHSFQWGVLHKAPQNNFHWGASFHFMANHTEQSSLSHIFFSPEFYYTLFQQKKIELLLSGAINLGFLTNITIKNNSDGEPNAWPLGFDFGVKSLVHFHPKWDVLLGLSYRYLKIIDAKDIQYADGSELILNSSNGIGFQLGLLYKF